jgi:hypothetical protein
MKHKLTSREKISLGNRAKRYAKEILKIVDQLDVVDALYADTVKEDVGFLLDRN